MKTTGRLLIATIVLTAALGQSGGALTLEQSAESMAAPRAVLPVTAFDFGDVYKGEVISQVFIIRNEGSADLQIKDIVTTCGCEAVDWDRVVPPRKEGKIIISLNTASQAGPIFKIAILRTNDQQFAITNLTLIANVLTSSDGGPVPNVTLRPGRHIGPLFVGPDVRWVLKAAPGKTGRFEFLVTVEKGIVNLKQVEADSKQIACSIEAVEPGRSYKVVVQSVPSDSPLSTSSQIRVRTDSTQLPWFPLQVILRVAKDI